MLPHIRRVSTTLFKEIIKKGSFSHCQFFLIKHMKIDGLSRFSVSIPKNVAKLAVSRNLIKRRVYSIIRKLDNRIKNNIAFIIIMKNGSEKIDFSTLSDEIEKNFVKYGFLK